MKNKFSKFFEKKTILILVLLLVFGLFLVAKKTNLNIASRAQAEVAAPAYLEPFFVDVPRDHWAYHFIQAIYRAGITSGCSYDEETGERRYCPEDLITRGQMAAFLVKAMGEAPVDPCQGVFTDVSTDHPFCGYIEKISELGITGGCAASPPRYCPENPITRGQMAVFLVRAIDETPVSSCQGTFADVPTTHPFCGFIEKVYALGITSGCSADPFNYCPSNNLTRAPMAVFLVKAFNVPWGEGKIQGYVKLEKPDGSTDFLAGAQVYAQKGTEEILLGTTDSSGYYLSQTVYADNYTLLARKEGYDTKTSVEVTLAHDQEAWAGDVIMVQRLGSVEGYVKDDEGKYVSGAIIEMADKYDKWIEVAATDRSGYFIKENLTAESHIFRAKKERRMYIAQNEVEIEVQPYINNWLDDLILQRAGMLTGKVYLETTDNPLAGVRIKALVYTESASAGQGEEEPAAAQPPGKTKKEKSTTTATPAAQTQALPSSTEGGLEYHGETDASGNYSFLLPVGRVLAWAGYYQYDYIEGQDAQITFNDRTSLDFNLGQDFPGSVKGKVYTADGGLVTDAAIMIDEDYIGYIDSEGDYYIPAIPGGYLRSVLIVRDDGIYYPSEYEYGTVDFDFGLQNVDIHGLTKYELEET